MIALRPATADDRAFWFEADSHATEAGFRMRTAAGLGYVIVVDGAPAGVLAYAPFWDAMPYLSLLWLKPSHRSHGVGSAAVRLWEDDMRKQGHITTLLSTQADETAQHFYRKLGYRDCGCLVLNDGPLSQPTELFLCKAL